MTETRSGADLRAQLANLDMALTASAGEGGHRPIAKKKTEPASDRYGGYP